MKPLTLVGLILPFAYVVAQFALALNGLPNALGFNPAEWTHRFLGDTALRILLLTLAITPLRDLTGWSPLLRIRRRIGLAAFAYGALHILAYLWLDLLWSLPALWEDVLKRTYITFGMAAFALMLPLAFTSTNGMIRRLGALAWRRLHWLIYPIAVLGVLHHLFMVKGNQPEPLVHGAILAALLGWRVYRWLAKPKPARKREPTGDPARSGPAGV
ncbi:sulfoxide reductase heme-binding subunit YedZ [bacterium]|nr:sulfoxide reductase heme-binding subunit YedZ [bacterium]